MSKKTWKKVLSVAMSMVICGSLLLPAMVATSVSAATPIKIACIGDSITAGHGASNASFAYPAQLQQLLGNGYEVKNYGHSGRTMLKNGDYPYVNEQQFTQSKDFQPDYVILMLGTNDAKMQNNWKAHSGEFEGDMKSIIAEYQALSSKPTVIVATSPTVGTTNIDIAEATVTGEVVPIQKKVAADMGCPIIDINALTKNAPQYYSDGIHPSDEGYVRLAKMFYDGLQDIFNARIQKFEVNGVAGVIDNEVSTVTVTLPYGSDVKAIEPTVTLADGAKIDKTGAQNFTSPVNYTVTSPDGKDTKTYAVTVKAQAKIKVACVGDSITEGSNGFTYVTQLQSNLGDGYEVKNFGHSGKTLLSDETRVFTSSPKYQSSLDYEPDVVTIMLGTNDSKSEVWSALGDKYEEELRAFVQTYLDLPSNPTVYIATSPTAHSTAHGIRNEILESDIVPIQKKVAAELGLTLIDAHEATKADASWFWDGIHPSEEGTKVLGKTYADIIKNDATTLLGFSVKNGANLADTIGVIDHEKNTVTVTMSVGTDLTTLQPVLTLPEGASYTIKQDVSDNPVADIQYGNVDGEGEVTANDALMALQAATQKIVLTDDQKRLADVDSDGDVSANDALMILQYATKKIDSFPAEKNLPETDEEEFKGFAEPVTYIITAADGTHTREYTVTVNVMDTVKIACVGDSMTAAKEYPNFLEEFLGNGYEIGRFGVNSTTAQKDGKKETGDGKGAYIYHPQYQQSLDFEPDIVLLTLGSNDSKQAGTNANWVTNWTEDSPANYERDLKDLVASYQAIGATVILGTSPSGFDTTNNWGAKVDIVNNVIAPIQRKVAADMGCFLTDFNAMTKGKETALIGGDGLHPNFNGYYALAGEHFVQIQNSMAAITDFAIGDAKGVIDQADKTIFVSVSDGTDLTALTPSITLSEGAVVDKFGVQNFGQPVVYTVTGASGAVVSYTVSVTSPSGVVVSKIEMQTPPTKTAYLLGDALDTTGASIAVVYTDGTREVVDVTPDMVSGYDWLKATKQTLSVNYNGKATSFEVQVTPHGVVGSFSAMSGKFRVLGNGQNLMYADWKWADQRPIDLSGYGDRSTLSLELDITFGSSQDIDPTTLWNQLVIKLRSDDKKDVEGDPETGNVEHNYGWNLYASSFDEKGSIHVSIPLNQVCTNKKGVMDWSTTGRIIIQCYLNDQYKTNSIDHYMDIQNVYIVDNAEAPTAPDITALKAAIAEAETVDTSLYNADLVAAFEAALDTAKAYVENIYASQADIDVVEQALTDAQAALNEESPDDGDPDDTDPDNTKPDDTDPDENSNNGIGSGDGAKDNLAQ